METITYLIQKNTNGKIKFIQFALNGATLTREWGLIGGVCQGTVNTYEAINVGKANEQSPEEAAEAKYKYIWNKKIKEGYVPTPSLDAIPALPDFLSKLDLDNIPKSFCLSKPTAKISETWIIFLNLSVFPNQLQRYLMQQWVPYWLQAMPEYL